MSVSNNKEKGLGLRLGTVLGQLPSMCKALGSVLVPKGAVEVKTKPFRDTLRNSMPLTAFWWG